MEPAVQKRWRLVPQFLLRRAGFAFGLIRSVGYTQVARAAAEVATSQRQLEEVRTRLLRQLLPTEVSRLAQAGERQALRGLSRWRSQVGRGRRAVLPAGPWSPELTGAARGLLAAAEQLEGARRQLEARLPEELFAARRQLRRLFRRPDLREALFLLSTDLVETMAAALDAEARPDATSADRALERRLYSFLQRLAAKNETTSFFGPLAYGEVDAAVERTTFGPETPTGVTRRETFAAFWAAAAFAKAAAGNRAIRAALPLRRVPVTRLEEQGAIAPDGARVPVSALQRQLYQAADGRRSAPQLAQQLGLPLAELEQAVVGLERALLVRRDLEPLSTTSHPLAFVREQLPDIPEAAALRQGLDAFTALLARFGEAPLEGRQRLLGEAERQFTASTGQPARRAAGQTYADRAVLYEDCLGDMQPVRMAPAEAEALERQLSPVLELGAAYGALRSAALKALAVEVLDGLGPRVSFLRFSAALDQRIAQGALRERDQSAAALLAQLSRRVEARSDGRVARLEPRELADLLDTPPKGRFASPDVMVHLEGGRVRYVIGEVHPYVFAWGSQGYFAPQKDRLFGAFTQDLSPWGGPERLATVLRRRRHKGLLGDAFPGTFIEVTGRAATDPERCLAIADLEVRRTEQGAELFGPRGPLTLYVGEDDHPHLRAFAPPLVEMPPVRLGAHTPRIEVGDLVLQRERWLLAEGAAEELRGAHGPAALAVAVAAAQARHGWPQVLFALSPSEPKPLCLDLQVPFAQQLLQRLLNQGPLTLSEMLPAPEGLWVHRAEGAHTSELRMALVRDP